MDLRATVGLLVVLGAVALKGALTGRTRLGALRRFDGLDRRREATAVSSFERWRMGRQARGDVDVAALARSAARALRGGDSAAQAFAAAAATAPPRSVARLAAARVDSVGLRAAVDEWRSADERPAVRLLVAAFAAGTSTGGSLARALDAAADTIEARAVVERETWAQAATARASAAVLVLAPLAFGAVASAGDRTALTFLLTTPAGLACLTFAVALDCLGAVWMAKITGRRW